MIGGKDSSIMWKTQFQPFPESYSNSGGGDDVLGMFF